MNEPYNIFQCWIDAKAEEAAAINRRRVVEDELIKLYGVNCEQEGSANIDQGQYKVKIVNRLNRKIDAEKLQELAAESGLDHSTVAALFRWKPELNLTAWKSASDEVKSAFAPAITTTAGRPSFSIEQKEQ